MRHLAVGYEWPGLSGPRVEEKARGASGPRRGWGAGPGPVGGIRAGCSGSRRPRRGHGDWRGHGPSTGRACSGAPDPRGNPPVPSARVTGHGQAKGFRAPRTADGGCRGPKVNLLWHLAATRDLLPPHSLGEAWLNEYATDSAEVS